jgi:hypothetical protein
MKWSVRLFFGALSGSAVLLFFAGSVFAATPLGVTQGIPSFGGYPMPQNCKSHDDPREISGAYNEYERQNQPPCRVTTTFSTKPERDGTVARLMVLSVHPVGSSVGQTAVLEVTQTGSQGVRYPLDANGNCTVTYGGVYTQTLPPSNCIDSLSNPKQFTIGTPVVVGAGEPVVVEWSVQPKQDYSYYWRSCTWYGACFAKVSYSTINYSFKSKGENFNTGGAFTGSVTVTPSSSGPTTYTLDDTAGHTISLTVNGTAQPSLTISANPSTIKSGATTTITWSASNVTACTTSGPQFATSQLRSGSQVAGPLTNNTLGPVTRIYTLSCSTPQGNASTSAQVTVQSVFCSLGTSWNGGKITGKNGASVNCPQNPAPPPNFSSSPQALPVIKSFSATRVDKGTPSTLSWSVTALTPGTVCSISPAAQLEGGASPGWSGPSANWQGTIRTVPLMGQTTFTLSCTNAGGTVSLTTNAQLIPSFKEL